MKAGPTQPAMKKPRRAPKRWQDAQDFRWAVRHWAARMDVKIPQVHLRAMRSKWASMSRRRKRLTFDASLLAMPREMGEYVIVHELVHFLAPNHGKVFKAFMAAYLPDWEARDQRLRVQATKAARRQAD